MGEHKFNPNARGGPAKPIRTFERLFQYARFVHFEFSPGTGLIALDADGVIWMRQATDDGTTDAYGNSRVVWVAMPDERCAMTVSTLASPLVS